MKIEQAPSKPPRFPPPADAHIARAVHNLIICVLIAAQVSSSSKPPMTRVAIGGKYRIRRCALPRYPAYCLDTCPALCRSMCYPLRRSPLWTNFPPPLLRRPASSKRGPRESSDDLKAKYLLAPVMMEAAAAQRFTLSATLSSSRS